MYDTNNYVDRLSADYGRVKLWMHWGSRGALQHRDVATYIHTKSIHCTERGAFANPLALITRNSSELTDTAPITHSLEYVAFPRPCNSPYSLITFENGCREIQFEQHFCFRRQQRCLLDGISSISLVFRFVIRRTSSFACRGNDPIRKRATYWLRLRPLLLLPINLWTLRAERCSLLFLSQLQSIMFLISCRF